MNRTSPSSRVGWTLLFIGTVQPDTAAHRTSAFSRAGNLAQFNLLQALTGSGADVSGVLTQLPQQAFPRGERLWSGLRRVQLFDGAEAISVPYINLPVVRPFCVGLDVLAGTVLWSWRQRRRRRVICTFNLTEPPGVFTWVAARLTGAKAVAWVNDINQPGQLVPDTWQRRLDFQLQRLLIPRFDGVVAVTRRILRDFAPGRPGLCIEGGVAAEVVEVGRRRPARTADGTFTMVAAGGLGRANGIHLILEAMRRLPDPRLRLRIAGKGALEDDVRRAAAEDPRIEFRGFLDHGAVLDLYQSADLLLNIRLTQDIDTGYFFPSKLLEYLASGAPLLTTCPGNVGEELADVAWLLEDESTEGLVAALSEVAALPSAEREARGRRAWSFAAVHKTWHAQAQAFATFVSGL